MALEISIHWDQEFNKTLAITCDESTCDNTNLILQEDICDECFSDSINATFIFKNIDRYISAGIEISKDILWDYISKNEFISINYKSPYDLISSDSEFMKRIKYKRLCPNNHDPIIFFDRSPSDTYSMPRYIYCGTEYFEAELF